MSLLTDDRAASPHSRGATDAAHFAIPATLWALDAEALAGWVAGFIVAQVVQLAPQVRSGLAWADFALDMLVTTAGPAAMFAAGVPVGDDAAMGFGALVAIGGLYTWRHRRAWGLAS